MQKTHTSPLVDKETFYTVQKRINIKNSKKSNPANLKGKSALIIFERHANLKYKYGNRYFWCRGYYERYILGGKPKQLREILVL